ncbi:unnamed protein product [Symbiodinium natans]|uniref:Uncharacterized protein n=1 Tax=Symbiodinium natans TaxID=878477 RepID=A0A812RGP1_9DINO|nr:unnamed protein product [Symbiodinium natans]
MADVSMMEALATSNDWRVRYENFLRLRSMGPKVLAQEAEALEGPPKRDPDCPQVRFPSLMLQTHLDSAAPRRHVVRGCDPLSSAVPVRVPGVRAVDRMIQAEAVQAVLEGFQSAEVADILASLSKLAGLLKLAREEAWSGDRQKVLSLLEQASAHSSHRQELVAFLSGDEGFLKAAVEKLRHAASASGKPVIAETATPQRSGTPTSVKHVVLNCANIGCTYGENVLKRTKGQNKFDWRGVEDAYNYYEGAGFMVHAIIGQRLLSIVGRDKISQKLESALVVIPSRDGLGDIDDYSTILEAWKWKCPYVDNDNYRGWGERMKGRPEVAKWYGETKRQLHVSYYFDRLGKFTPLHGAAPAAHPHRAPASEPPAASAPAASAASSTSGSSPSTARESRQAPGEGQDAAQREKRGVQQVQAPASSEPAAKRPRGDVEVIELGKNIVTPPTGGPTWKALVALPVWQRPSVGGFRDRLRTLQPGAVFRQIAQHPKEGKPLWLALHPRGWVEVSGADGTANVLQLT